MGKEKTNSPARDIVDLDAVAQSVGTSVDGEVYEQHPYVRGTQNMLNSGVKNCLRNERVIVRKLPKKTGLIPESNHIMGDGMHDAAARVFCVPKLQRSNNFVNVLTNDEKQCLEMAMGYEPNALSIYRQPAESNFWSNANPSGLSTVRLGKRDNVFNLANPLEYIQVKILLANKDKICPSMAEYQERPKETYEYVIIREGEENKDAQSGTDATIQAFMKLGKINDDKDVLRLVVETMMGKKYSDNTSIEWLQTQASDLIKSSVKNARLFLNVVGDESLDAKVLIRKCITKGIIADRGGFLYIKDTNTPMCSDGEDPTMKMAARWLSRPQNQEILFSLQAKVKE